MYISIQFTKKRERIWLMFEYQTTGTFIRFVGFLPSTLPFREFLKAGGVGGCVDESRLQRWVGLGVLVSFGFAPSSGRGDEGPASDSDLDDLQPEMRRMVLQGLSSDGLGWNSDSCSGSTSRGKVRHSHGCTGRGTHREKYRNSRWILADGTQVAIQQQQCT